MKTRIEIGGVVTVSFPTDEVLNRVTVLHIPKATGDSWVFQSADATINRIWHVSEGCTVSYVEELT